MIKYFVAILLSIALAACGGGGDSAPTPAATYSISGTVTQSGGTTAVAGATIALSGASSASTTSAADGTYSFTGLTNGGYTVTPTKTGSAFSPVSTAVSVSGANVTNTNFTAAAAGTTTYSISGAVSGAATSGVIITLTGANSGTAVTGPGGIYTFSGLVAGSYTLAASLSGYTFSPSIPVTIVAADSTANDFVATAIPVAHSLSGHVSGATGVTITVTGTASPTPVTTDGSGNYTVTGLYDGQYTVTPSKTGYTFTPNSTGVTMSGADVTQTNFTGASNASVVANVSGSITGAWVEGVTITMSGAATGNPTSNASGNYTFTGLPSGAQYVFTPSLAGYTFSPASQTVNIPAGSSTAVTVPAFTAASTVPSYSISGTVSYSGTQTGPVNLKVWYSGCVGCIPAAGTSIAAPGAYVIRGLAPGSYVVSAAMDTLGTGQANATKPQGSSTIAISAANAAGVNVALADPTVPPAATPTGLTVYPSNGTAFIQWNQVNNAGGTETVSAYKIYWSTDNFVTSSSVTVTAHNDAMYIQSGLANVATYFKISALVNGVEGTPSAVFGPVNIGATTGANTVSGTVTFPGTASGPLLVGAYNPMTGAVYFTKIAAPVSPQSYSFAGVPDGTYANFAVIDMNANGSIDAGDIGNTNNNNMPMINLPGPTGGTIALTSSPATAQVNTQFYSNGTSYSNYSLELNVINGTKAIKTVTLISGLNMPLPQDMGRDWSGFRVWQSQPAAIPVVGDSYVFRVTYADNTTQDMTGSVTAVLDASNLAQAPTVSFTAPGSATVPLFSWMAPATAPAAPYSYRVSVNGGGANWWSNNIPSSALSALYNQDGSANMASLPAATAYTWQVVVNDAKGNGATLQASPFTTP